MSHTLPEGQSQQVAELSVAIDSYVISSDVITRFIVLEQVRKRRIFFIRRRPTDRHRLKVSDDREVVIFGYVREVTETGENCTTCRVKNCVYYVRIGKILIPLPSAGF
jgi:hypothetical protein